MLFSECINLELTDDTHFLGQFRQPLLTLVDLRFINAHICKCQLDSLSLQQLLSKPVHTCIQIHLDTCAHGHREQCTGLTYEVAEVYIKAFAVGEVRVCATTMQYNLGNALLYNLKVLGPVRD